MFKSIRSFSGLLSGRIRNRKRMKRRRMAFTLGVASNTPYALLVTISSLLQGIIEAQNTANFDHAYFKTYGVFTLDFEVVHYMASTDYALFMDTQQTINLEIYRQFAEAGIELPYPTQTVLLKREER